MPDAFGQTSSDSALWAVVAVMGKIIRIAEIYPNRNAALADQAWRESQVRAYAGFLDSASQPFPRYAVKAIRRTDLPGVGSRFRPWVFCGARCFNPGLNTHLGSDEHAS
jgi:hypothetical protein